MARTGAFPRLTTQMDPRNEVQRASIKGRAVIHNSRKLTPGHSRPPSWGGTEGGRAASSSQGEIQLCSRPSRSQVGECVHVDNLSGCLSATAISDVLCLKAVTSDQTMKIRSLFQAFPSGKGHPCHTTHKSQAVGLRSPIFTDSSLFCLL